MYFGMKTLYLLTSDQFCSKKKSYIMGQVRGSAYRRESSKSLKFIGEVRGSAYTRGRLIGEYIRYMYLGL